MLTVAHNYIGPTQLAHHKPTLALCMLIALSITQHTAQKKDRDDTVRLHADLVVVTVTVTDPQGRYVHGLNSKDFIILEDGKPQQVDGFFSQEAAFAAAILIDMSGSMEYKFGLVRGAAASFIEQIRDDDQVAVYGFNRKVRQIQDFTNVRTIADAVWDLEAKEETAMYDCLDEAVSALAKRPEKRRAALLISDGVDNASHKATFDSAVKKALASGVTIYTVDLIEDERLLGNSSEAVLLRRGRSELQELARQSGGSYIHSPHGDKLDEAFANIIDELRNQYTLTYYSTNDKRDGRWRALTVSVSRAGLAVRARRGYYAPKG
jgi:Ca-activated chloride channel family protein